MKNENKTNSRLYISKQSVSLLSIKNPKAGCQPSRVATVAKGCGQYAKKT